ncbi:hypothetical protein [Nitratifractor sp.]
MIVFDNHFGYWGASKAQSLVVGRQSLETSPRFFIPRNIGNVFSNGRYAPNGGYGQTAVPRLFSFSLLHFFFSLVAKTKRKRNEGEKAVSHGPSFFKNNVKPYSPHLLLLPSSLLAHDAIQRRVS